MTTPKFTELLDQYLLRSRKQVQEVAKDADISAPYLSQIRKGKRSPPSPELVKRIAEAIGNLLPAEISTLVSAAEQERQAEGGSAEETPRFRSTRPRSEAPQQGEVAPQYLTWGTAGGTVSMEVFGKERLLRVSVRRTDASIGDGGVEVRLFAGKATSPYLTLPVLRSSEVELERAGPIRVECRWRVSADAEVFEQISMQIEIARSPKTG